MEEERKSFLFHREWYDAISSLEPTQRCEVYDAIMSKVFEHTEIRLSPISEIAMKFISPQIARDTDKWLEIKTKRKESGKQGGLAKKANATKCYQMLPNASKCKQNIANVANNDDNNSYQSNNNNNYNKEKEEKEDNKLSPKKKTVRFVKPTVEEIAQYIAEKNYHINAESFFNFYESKGWVVGKSPMKDWKAATRTWEKTWEDNHPQQMSNDLFSSIKMSNKEELVINGQIYK